MPPPTLGQRLTDHVVSKLGRRRSGTRSAVTNVTITATVVERMGLIDHLSKIPIVHIAGTKGKGTTAHYTAQLLQHHHLRKNRSSKVALFTSPHLTDVRERIRINGAFVEARQFVKLFDEFEAQYSATLDSVLKDLSSSSSSAASSSPSSAATIGVQDKFNFFRAFFVFSLYLMRYFSVDAAVIEVGIGGRLDPTVVVPSPAVCAVTSLGLDHVELLGDDVKDIAFEKAGIFKPGAACFSAPQRDYPETRAVLEKAAADCGNQLQFPVSTDFVLNDGQQEQQQQQQCFEQIAERRGDHMVENAALAVVAARIAAGRPDWRGPLDAGEADVLLNCEMEGRSHSSSWKNGSTVMLDGAHTVESVKRAARWAFSRLSGDDKKMTVVYSTSRPPAPQLAEIAEFRDKIDRIIFCNISEVPSAKTAAERCRAAWIDELGNNNNKNNHNKNQDISSNIVVDVVETPADALELAASAKANADIFVTGSMFTVGGCLSRIKGEDV